MKIESLGNIFYTIIENLCKGDCPLELSLEKNNETLSFKSIYLLISSEIENSFAIDYLQPSTGNNLIFPNQPVKISFCIGRYRYFFYTKIINKEDSNKLIWLKIPDNLEKKDRRQYPRIPVDKKNIPVIFNFSEGNSEKKSEKREGKLINISRGGLAFCTNSTSLNNLLNPGDSLEISVNLTKDTPASTTYFVEVIHIHPNNICGCKFLNKEAHTQQEIQTLTNQKGPLPLVIPGSVDLKVEITTSKGNMFYSKILEISDEDINISRPEAFKLLDNKEVFLKFNLQNNDRFLNVSGIIKKIKDDYINVEFNNLNKYDQKVIEEFIS